MSKQRSIPNLASITVTLMVLAALLAVLWVSGVFKSLPDQVLSASVSTENPTSSLLSKPEPAAIETERQSTGGSNQTLGPHAQVIGQQTLAIWKDGMLIQDKAGLDLLAVDAEEYRDVIWGDFMAVRASDIDALGDQAEQGDPEAAYLLFLFYHGCYGLPVSEHELVQVIEQLEASSIAAVDGSGHSSGGDSILNNAEIATLFRHQMVDCTMTQLEAQGLAFDWLERAAVLGHISAETDFVRWGKTMLSQYGLYLREPHRVAEFKLSAVIQLKRAIRAGHPEAMMNMAMELHDGLLMETNLLQAYSWAHAADLAYRYRGYESKSGMDQWLLRELVKALSSRDIKAARKRGRELFEEYVDQSS